MSASREKKIRQDLAAKGITDPKKIREAEEKDQQHRSNMLYGGIAVVFVLVAAFRLLWNSNALQRGATAVTVDGEKYSAAEVDYFYYNAYSSIRQNQYASYMGIDTSKPLSQQDLSSMAKLMLGVDEDMTWDAYLKQNGKYAKNESKITFQDVADCLVLVTNCFSTQTSYENQTKKSINNRFIQEAMTEFFRSRLQVYFLENKQEADRIAEQVLINKRSRETAEKARLNIKKKLTGNVDLANRVQKFVDCRSKDVSRREIYIVEGDSALGACKLSRDAEFQGIMPVRGKILNCLKADYARIFKSDVITDLMRVLGCGVEVQSKQAKDLSAFNLENLRWNKVIICTDADVDGFQIRTLILTMLYRLAPTLIREGYVYIAESPLYEIVSKGKTYFAYSDREKAAIVDSLGGAKADINRSKGLGENDPEMMWLTTMNPDTRKLIRVMPEDVERTAQMFDLLLGDNLAGRKAHIAECGSQFLDLADIS